MEKGRKERNKEEKKVRPIIGSTTDITKKYTEKIKRIENFEKQKGKKTLSTSYASQQEGEES